MKTQPFQLRKATRKQTKIRLGFSGASGFGKTYSALLVANGICEDWSKIAVIDTENQSADLYSDLGDYNVITLEPPYSPERYIGAIKACEDAEMEVIIIDSISHEWDGQGGCLEIQEKLGGRYQDWAKITPRHKAFIDTVLHSKCHVLTTVRRKQDYDMTSENGKTKVVKVGTKEVTREGFEYELTVNFEILNDRHMTKASKDRTGLFMNEPEFIPTKETGKIIKAWCEKGDVQKEVEINLSEVNSLLDQLKVTPEQREKTIATIKTPQDNSKMIEILTSKLENYSNVEAEPKEMPKSNAEKFAGVQKKKEEMRNEVKKIPNEEIPEKIEQIEKENRVDEIMSEPIITKAEVLAEHIKKTEEVNQETGEIIEDSGKCTSEQKLKIQELVKKKGITKTQVNQVLQTAYPYAKFDGVPSYGELTEVDAAAFIERIEKLKKK